jgi:transcriptional regulator with XRE-family HTH domain
MRSREPNRLLAWERLQRGWSYEEVADRLKAEMERCGETDTGLTANTVRRWDTGERRPDPRYRKHLVSVIGNPASELGLLNPDELQMRPDAWTPDDTRRLLSMVGLDAVGSGGVQRATVLRGLAVAGAMPLLAPLLGLRSHVASTTAPRHIDPETYVTITHCHRQLYWTTPARPLFEAAYAHAHLGVELLGGAGGSARPTIAAALAESALLTARLALFDLNSPAIAERCFDVALAATREAGDHALAAVVLGHVAFMSVFGPTPHDARSPIEAALQHTWHGVTPAVRAWLHCVASEAEGRAGNGMAARHEIDLAAKAMDSEPEQPEWLDFFDAVRLRSFAGYAALSAGDNADAATYLSQALDGLDQKDGKQRSVILADLARAHEGDLERAGDYLAQAIDVLYTDWRATGHRRSALACRATSGASRTRRWRPAVSCGLPRSA